MAWKHILATWEKEGEEGQARENQGSDSAQSTTRFIHVEEHQDETQYFAYQHKRQWPDNKTPISTTRDTLLCVREKPVIS